MQGGEALHDRCVAVAEAAALMVTVPLVLVADELTIRSVARPTRKPVPKCWLAEMHQPVAKKIFQHQDFIDETAREAGGGLADVHRDQVEWPRRAVSARRQHAGAAWSKQCRHAKKPVCE